MKKLTKKEKNYWNMFLLLNKPKCTVGRPVILKKVLGTYKNFIIFTGFDICNPERDLVYYAFSVHHEFLFAVYPWSFDSSAKMILELESIIEKGAVHPLSYKTRENVKHWTRI